MRRRRSLDRPYVLSVGTVQPRKNLPRLIAAVRRLRERTGEDIVLVHAGRRGWLYAEVERAVQEHALADLVPADSRTPTIASYACCTLARWRWPTRRSTRALACPVWKRWPVAAPSWPRMCRPYRKWSVTPACWWSQPTWKP